MHGRYYKKETHLAINSKNMLAIYVVVASDVIERYPFYDMIQLAIVVIYTHTQPDI